MSRMTPFVRVIFPLLLVLAVAVVPVLGATTDNFIATATCSGFFPTGSFAANRDNTGAGAESIAINVVDGNGTVILQVIDAVPLNWSVTPASILYPWTTEPTANPLNVSVISLAGNGLAEQVLYTTRGACPGLPTGTVTDAVGALANAGAAGALGPASTTVSPPIFLGQRMPTPTTNTAAIEALPTYAIVNTTNLNLRSGDGPQFLPVAVLRGGTRTRVVGRNDTASWWLLEANGFVGWASAEFVAVRGDASDLPVVPSRGTLIPASMVLAVPKPVFSEPTDLLNRVICTAAPGEYYLNGRNASGTYYQGRVACEDGRTVDGWILAEEVLFRNPAGNLLPEVE
jgi:hypothetical protein